MHPGLSEPRSMPTYVMDVAVAPAGPSAAGASGQNATMRVLSLEGRPSPGWTPGWFLANPDCPFFLPSEAERRAMHTLGIGVPEEAWKCAGK